MHRHAIVSLILSALLLYGGLFPLHGWHAGNAIAFLAERQSVRSGLDDLLVNVLVFMPLGFVTLLALNQRYRPWRSLVLALLHGFSLSFAIEAFQAFLPMRYSSLADLATNTLGTALGAGAAWWYRSHAHATHTTPAASPLHDPVARLVLVAVGAWALAPLLPLNPVTDLAHLRARIDFLRVAATPAHPWSIGSAALSALTVFALGQLWRAAALPAARVFAALALPLLARLILGDSPLRADEGAGAVLGLLALWAFMPGIGRVPSAPDIVHGGIVAASAHRQALLAAGVLLAVFVISETLPGMHPAYRAFNWVPFRAHLQNPVLGIEALLDVIWIAVSAAACLAILRPGARWGWALAVSVTLGLATLVLEINQVRLPGRTPDVTSAIVMALCCLLACGAVGMLRRGRARS